jgi:hypothetical protein
MFNSHASQPARVLVRYGTAADADNRQLIVIPAGATRAADLPRTTALRGRASLLVESDLPLAVADSDVGPVGSSRVGQHAELRTVARQHTSRDRRRSRSAVLSSSTPRAPTTDASFLRQRRSRRSSAGRADAGARKRCGRMPDPQVVPGDVAAVFDGRRHTDRVSGRACWPRAIRRWHQRGGQPGAVVDSGWPRVSNELIPTCCWPTPSPLTLQSP